MQTDWALLQSYYSTQLPNFRSEKMGPDIFGAIVAWYDRLNYTSFSFLFFIYEADFFSFSLMRTTRKLHATLLSLFELIVFSDLRSFVLLAYNKWPF